MTAIRIIAVLLIGLASTSISAQKLAIVTGEWPPYVGAALPGFGPIAEVVTSACHESGLEVEISFFPWARCEIMLTSGKAFAAFPYTNKNENRIANFDFSDLLMPAGSKIYFVAGRGRDIAWTTLKDFAGSTFAGVLGYWYMDELKNNGISALTCYTAENAFVQLKEGHVDYVIENDLVAALLIDRIFGKDAPKVRAVTKPVLEDNLYLMISRSYPGSSELLKRFNAGLAAIRKNGEYQKILDAFLRESQEEAHISK